MGLDLCHVRPSKEETLEYFTMDELDGHGDYWDRYKHLVRETKAGEDSELTSVLYVADIGYLRKQMTAAFYADFENCKLYFDKPSVEKAFQYLEADSLGALEQLKNNFRANFIDNFIEGESIFFASW